MAGEDVRVVRRVAGHREDRAGLRVERRDGPDLALQALPRGLLGVGVERQHDAAALLGVTAEEIGHAIHEQPVVRTGEHLACLALDTVRAEDEGVEAGDRGVQRPVGVPPEVLQVAL